MSTVTTRDDVREALIEALADVEAATADEIEDDISGLGGDNLYELESKTAEAIIGPLSVKFGKQLPGPVDLKPEEYATVESLTDLIFTALTEERN